VGNTTIRSLWNSQVRLHGSETFLIFQDAQANTEEFSYAQFDEQINRAANFFLRTGIEKGDKVAVQLCSCPEFLLCLFGLAKIGAIMVPLNDQGTKHDSRYALENCQAKSAIVGPKQLGIFREFQEEGLIPNDVIVARAEGSLDATLNFNAEVAKSSPVLADPDELSSDDVAEIIFTSGTTSEPKGVVLTHCNLVYSGLYGVWQTSLRPDDRLLTTMPACHSNFQLAALMPVLAAGACLILIEKYSAHKFWKQIRLYKATVTQSVSMMIRTLLMQPVAAGERDHCLRDILHFMPLSDEEKQEFEDRFAVRLLNSFGSTESVTWIVTDPPTGERNWPSVGRAGLSYEIQIVDENNTALPPHEIGEICVKGVRGRTLMLEYFNDPEETAAAFDTEGWMHTSDKGYIDEDGWVFFVDRKANMVKRAGENVSTIEIENLLTDYPGIAEAAVIGVPDPIRDMALKAFVLPKKGTNISVEEIFEYCKANLAPFKVPSFVEIREEFPRTCSMKIAKKLLQ
jgi:crotonobetaine/carnitine-CoA ligase